ncbi:LysR family transcriptional regulator [Mitsuaria sp. GD03876]|uniref:LysR family transcriptional regulator n=1 Tax=Mitsuaria sp. GD03876 TaxID=2975399 RepID=UPI00244AAF3A|nr:LysR family transcriptional regulator [Mitsuaria sp. GD03876]MDH0864964.1 LysR family transcriptional regulator [Mitsuaria sp. GD03876]
MNELDDMRLFVRAVAAGSLSAAGRELGFSPAVGSKRLARLEARLGVRLLQRSSRRLALTDEGALYLERCQSILSDIDDAEAELAQGRQHVRGLLRITSTVALGRRCVGPLAAEFMRQHPEVTVQVSLSDALVDLIEEGFDCAVRIGGPSDSRLVARRLGPNRRVLCATPEYLRRHGTPRSLDELAAHDCILQERVATRQSDWLFMPADASVSASPRTVTVQGRLVTDNGEQAHDWALAGLGLVRRAVWDVVDELDDGRLVEILPEWAGEVGPLQLVFPSRRLLPARSRLFIDALVARFQDSKDQARVRVPMHRP